MTYNKPISQLFNLYDIVRYTKLVWTHLLNHPNVKDYSISNQNMVVEDESIMLLHNTISDIYTKDSTDYTTYAETSMIGSLEHSLPCEVVISDIVSSFSLSIRLINNPKFCSPIPKNKKLHNKIADIKRLLSQPDKIDALNEMTSFFSSLEEELFQHPINFSVFDMSYDIIGNAETASSTVIEL